MNNCFLELFMNNSKIIIHELFTLKGRIMNYSIIQGLLINQELNLGFN